MKILLLEDHVDIGYALAEALRHERYQVEWVTSDNAAARAAAEQRFDLAVLDVMIGPREDAGFELAAQLRDAGFEGQLLFVSARDAELDRVRGLDLGGDDYLVKPFGLAEFLRACGRCCAAARRHGARCSRGPRCPSTSPTAA